MRTTLTLPLVGLVAATLVCAGCATPRITHRSHASDAVSEQWKPTTMNALTGRTWVLRSWNGGEAAPTTPVVTLQVQAGRILGRSGCNRYTVAVTGTADDGAISVGPVAATRMMCPEPAHAVESRFLAALAGAHALRIREGRLGLTYAQGAGAAMLIFEETSAGAP